MSGCTDTDLAFNAKHLGFLLMTMGRTLCNIGHSIVGGEALRDAEMAGRQVTAGLRAAMAKVGLLSPAAAG